MDMKTRDECRDFTDTFNKALVNRQLKLKDRTRGCNPFFFHLGTCRIKKFLCVPSLKVYFFPN